MIIPILLYHTVTKTPSSKLAPFTVSPKTFAQHLDLLLEKGYTCVTISELVKILRDHSPRQPQRQKVAAITFDDGYKDFAESALPLLLERKLASTMYLTTGWLEDGRAREPGPEDRFLSFNELPELAEQGVELGSHSHTHPQMDTLSRVDALTELAHSRALLEDALHEPVNSFAYPHGYHSARIGRMVREVGYTSAAAVKNALSHAHDHPFALGRLMVMHDTATENVANWLDGTGAPLSRAKPRLATLGWRSFRRGKALLTRQAGSDWR